MEKNIFKETIKRLNAKKNGYSLVTHKQGWLNFLQDGDLVFKPSELHQILRKVIQEFQPKGEKLLHQRNRDNFTVTDGKTPYRPEEALERFITASNSDKFFNQVPIGGGKESIDIVINENNVKYVFVELKPWSNTNSPLYAIVESLKNLMEYRMIHKNNITHNKDCKHYNDVDLMILAPLSYYQHYDLTEGEQDKISKVQKALNDLSNEFNTNISLMALTLTQDDFLDKLKRICEENKVSKQQIISITKSDAISELARDQWRRLVSSVQD